MVASEFDPETLSAVAWLIANHVDISCFAVTPGTLLNSRFINVEKILPPPLLEDHYVPFREPVVASSPRSSASSGSRRSRARIRDIMQAGLLQPGEILRIRNKDNSQATVVDASQVDFQGTRMSFNEWGQKVTGWQAIGIYEQAETSSGRLLKDLRLQLEADQERQSQVEATKVAQPASDVEGTLQQQ